MLPTRIIPVRLLDVIIIWWIINTSSEEESGSNTFNRTRRRRTQLLFYKCTKRLKTWKQQWLQICCSFYSQTPSTGSCRTFLYRTYTRKELILGILSQTVRKTVIRAWQIFMAFRKSNSVGRVVLIYVKFFFSKFLCLTPQSCSS